MQMSCRAAEFSEDGEMSPGSGEVIGDPGKVCLSRLSGFFQILPCQLSSHPGLETGDFVQPVFCLCPFPPSLLNRFYLLCFNNIFCSCLPFSSHTATLPVQLQPTLTSVNSTNTCSVPLCSAARRV